MLGVKLVLAALMLGLSMVATAIAARCERCTVAGAPETAPECGANGGILVFNSVPPNVPAYWTLFAKRRGLRTFGRLNGRLEVWADVVDPGVPGFPGRLKRRTYVGRSARFRGTIQGDQVQAVTKYANGSTCEFRLRLAFGLAIRSPTRSSAAIRPATCSRREPSICKASV